MSWLSQVLRKGRKPAKRAEQWPAGYGDAEKAIFRAASPHTMTDSRRVLALIQATRHVARYVPGDIVECGVWKGGSMMVVARTLLEAGTRDRNLYLFDTFEGMTQPTDKDVEATGATALQYYEAARMEGSVGSEWCRSPLEEVRANMESTGYPAALVHYAKGKVEDTIPRAAPERIALLRLDTDWYESTRHEMIHLFPRLSVGGVLIVDDYFWWRGSREAVDEYVARNKLRLLLTPVEGGACIGVKEA